MKLLRKTFPLPTEAMINSLRHIDKLEEIFGFSEAKVIVIAGSDHFQPLNFQLNNPLHDLSKLYLELENHKAVILIPSHLEEYATDEFNLLSTSR